MIQVASPNGKRSLGCSIFKGRRPEDTGIYVQAAKQGGLARRAGLRPGDQVTISFRTYSYKFSNSQT